MERGNSGFLRRHSYSKTQDNAFCVARSQHMRPGNAIPLIERGIFVARWRQESRQQSVAVLEMGGIDMKALQQLVEIRAVSIGKTCCTGNIAARQTQYLAQILSRERIARIRE